MCLLPEREAEEQQRAWTARLGQLRDVRAGLVDDGRCIGGDGERFEAAVFWLDGWAREWTDERKCVAAESMSKLLTVSREATALR